MALCVGRVKTRHMNKAFIFVVTLISILVGHGFNFGSAYGGRSERILRRNESHTLRSIPRGQERGGFNATDTKLDRAANGEYSGDLNPETRALILEETIRYLADSATLEVEMRHKDVSQVLMRGGLSLLKKTALSFSPLCEPAREWPHILCVPQATIQGGREAGLLSDGRIIGYVVRALAHEIGVTNADLDLVQHVDAMVTQTRIQTSKPVITFLVR